MHDYFASNPYRILGIYANATMKEIVAASSRIMAYRRAGRKFSTPIDLPKKLGKVDRSKEKIEKAESTLKCDDERLKWSQFWFLKCTTDDKKAFELLEKNKFKSAKHIWNQNRGMSALQNLAVLSLINNDIQIASFCLSKLYTTYREAFLAAVHLPAETSVDMLVTNYATAVVNKVPDYKIPHLVSDTFDEEWNNLMRRFLFSLLANDIQDALDKHHDSGNTSLEQRFYSAKNLRSATYPKLSMLRNYLYTDKRYIVLSEEIADVIQNCCIDYKRSLAGKRVNKSVYDDIHKLFSSTETLLVSYMAKQKYQSRIEELGVAQPTENESGSDSGNCLALILFLVISGLIVRMCGCEHKKSRRGDGRIFPTYQEFKRNYEYKQREEEKKQQEYIDKLWEEQLHRSIQNGELLKIMQKHQSK